MKPRFLDRPRQIIGTTPLQLLLGRGRKRMMNRTLKQEENKNQRNIQNNVMSCWSCVRHEHSKARRKDFTTCCAHSRGEAVGAIYKQWPTAAETWWRAFNLLMMKWLARRNNDETPPAHQSVARRRVSVCQDYSQTDSLLLQPRYEMFPSLLRTFNFPIFVERLLLPQCYLQTAYPQLHCMKHY